MEILILLGVGYVVTTSAKPAAPHPTLAQLGLKPMRLKPATIKVTPITDDVDDGVGLGDQALQKICDEAKLTAAECKLLKSGDYAAMGEAAIDKIKGLGKQALVTYCTSEGVPPAICEQGAEWLEDGLEEGRSLIFDGLEYLDNAMPWNW